MNQQESTPFIKLVEINSRIYNAADHPNHMRGGKVINGKVKKNACQLIYSVHFVESKTNLAHCQSWNIYGDLIEEKIPLNHLIPLKKEII